MGSSRFPQGSPYSFQRLFTSSLVAELVARLGPHPCPLPRALRWLAKEDRWRPWEREGASCHARPYSRQRLVTSSLVAAFISSSLGQVRTLPSAGSFTVASKPILLPA